MGLFKGNKNKGSDDESQKQPTTARRSRRVVVPGAKGTASAPAKVDSTRVQNRTSAAPAPAARPQTHSIKRTSTKSESDRVAKAPADDGLMLGSSGSAPATGSASRPKSREPIRDSQPLDFAGDLSSAEPSVAAGPARTGDAALLEFLVNKANLMTQDQANSATTKAGSQGKPIDVALVDMNLVSEDQLVSALTQECWVPHLRVDKYEIRKKALDTIAREDAVRYSVFPVDKLGSLLTLAMVNPLDVETIRTLESKTGLDIKKVVATRTEISQGIEKYYSGQVVAKDSSISFTQDAGVETKSVTQLLTNVAVKDDFVAEPSLSMDDISMAPSAPVKTESNSNIIPEIEDIDDLLSSDEVIAPAIIEPIGIEAIDEFDDLEPAAIPDAEIEPLGINPGVGDVAFDDLDDISIAAPEPMIAPAASRDDGIDVGDIDLGLDDTAPIELPPSKIAKSAKSTPVPAPASLEDLFLDDVGISASAKADEPTPMELPIVPAAKTSAPKAPAPTANKPIAPAAKPAAAKSGAPRAAHVVNLVPVMEEEFQHAITHGKAHLFERWTGLQTRNRIINGIQVEAELEPLLAGLFDAPRRVG